MNEQIRSLVCILFFSISVFIFLKSTALLISTKDDFTRRCNLWLGLTIIIFITQSMMAYIILGSFLMLFVGSKDKNKVALFFFVVFALPPISFEIPAFGLVNFLFDIEHIRLMVLTIFFPVYFSLSQKKDSVRFLETTPDKYLGAYLIWCVLLMFMASTMTNTLRVIFYFFIDIFLPYYVVSRSLKTIQDFRDALFSFVVAVTVIAVIGIFEFYKEWLIYDSLGSALGIPGAMGGYLLREGSLRVMASTQQPLVFGYLLVIALGFFLVIQKYIRNRIVRGIWLALILAALIAPQSRGPWLGALVMILIFIITGSKILSRLFVLGIAGSVAFGVMLLTPFGEKIIKNLPFIGTSGQGDITYRQLLIENCIRLVGQHPFFGVPNVLFELQSMKQGEGIVDIVNTYVSVALSSGLVGLILFLCFFLTIIFGIYMAMRRVENIDADLHLIGRVLLATLIAILVMISTVSSISFIPIAYWSVAGLGLAYIQVAKRFILPQVLNEPLIAIVA